VAEKMLEHRESVGSERPAGGVPGAGRGTDAADPAAIEGAAA
jgi:hypothetical protein